MTKTITIQGVMVDVAQPYEAGHAITEAEAKALNQVRAENIGNNCRKAIKDMLEEAGGDASAVAKSAAALVAEKDKEYEFTLANAGGGGRAKLDPIEKEARTIARAFVGQKITEAGMTQKAYLEANGPDAIKDKIAELAGHEKIIEMAKKALKEREKMAEATADLSI